MMKMEYKMGVNPFAEVLDDEDPLGEHNCDGEDKAVVPFWAFM